jgi:hypothetical protein
MSGLTYTQTTQGKGLSTLSVPTTTKARDTRVAAEKKYIPKGWQETLLPTLLNVGIQGMGMYHNSQARKAKTAATASYIDNLAKDTKVGMTLDAVAKGAADKTITDKKVIEEAKANASSTKRLESWGTSYSNTINSLDDYDLSEDDKLSIISDINKNYTSKVIELQKEVYDDKKKEGIQSLSSDNFKDTMVSITSGTYDPSKIDTATINGLKGWGDKHEDIRKTVNNNVVKSLSYIEHNSDKLGKLYASYKNYIDTETKKGDKSKLTQNDLTTFGKIQTYYDADVKRNKAVKAEDARATKKVLTDTIKVYEQTNSTKGTYSYNDMSIADGMLTPTKFGTMSAIPIESFKDKEAIINNGHIPEYYELLIKNGDSPELARIKEKKLIEKYYYNALGEKIQDEDGITRVDVSTVTDPKFKTTLETHIKQQVNELYSNNDFNSLQEVAKFNQDIVTKQLKGQVTTELSTVFGTEDIATRNQLLANANDKIDAMGPLATSLISSKDRKALEFLNQDPTRIDRVNKFRSGELKPEDYRYSQTDFTEKVKGLPSDIQIQVKKDFQEYGILYGDTMTPDALLDKAVADSASLTFTNNDLTHYIDTKTGYDLRYATSGSHDITYSKPIASKFDDKESLHKALLATGAASVGTPTFASYSNGKILLRTRDPKGNLVNLSAPGIEGFTQVYNYYKKKKTDVNDARLRAYKPWYSWMVHKPTIEDKQGLKNSINGG